MGKGVRSSKLEHTNEDYEGNLNWKDRRLIRELYKGQKVTVRVENEESEDVIIGRGVRQGCCMSPVLFNLYAEKLLEEALETSAGVKVGDHKIKNIKYADDQAVLAESEEELQSMLINIHEAGIRYGMRINVGKTKVMKVGKTDQRIELTLEGEDVEQVDGFKYLGGKIYSNGSCTEEIRSRIAMGKTAYMKVQDLLTARSIGTPEAEEKVCKVSYLECSTIWIRDMDNEEERRKVFGKF